MYKRCHTIAPQILGSYISVSAVQTNDKVDIRVLKHLQVASDGMRPLPHQLSSGLRGLGIGPHVSGPPVAI